MPQFQYTAVNSSGKKLNGMIGAESEDDARKQLNTFGISLLSIETISDSSTATSEEGLTKFEFEAYDKSGQKVVGTVPASNRFKAFTRLKEEYQFEVAYVVSMGASDEEKEKAKQEDMTMLKTEYEQSAQLNGKAKADSVLDGPIENDPRFVQRRETLLKRVDIILEKIKELLTNYSDEIKPENKKIIQSYIDKLLRIKSSTNLDYIEHISENLLKKVQDQELFLHKDRMEKDRQKLKVETQQLMAELHSKPQDNRSILGDLENIHQKLHVSENRLLKGVSQFLERFIDTPEVKTMKAKIQLVNRQVWSFRKIWLLANKAVKPEAYASLQKVIAERDRLKAELKALQKKENEQYHQVEEEKPKIYEPLILQEVTHFLGWLLSFYMAAYFISHYVLAKAFKNGNPLPGDFNLLYSGILRTLLISIFLWYVLFSLRLQYFKHKAWVNLLVLPLGMLINAGLVLNL